MKRFLLWQLMICAALSGDGQETRWVVAQDGSGRFRTVQAALNAITPFSKKPVTIFVKNGIYREKLFLDSTRTNVRLIGEDKFSTILTYQDHAGKILPSGDTINTYTSASFLMQADDFTAENISFRNDAGFDAGQAVAVQVSGDMAVFRNCRFIGNQDVLFTSGERSRQYYRDCYIEGTTDFIFGASTAWFQGCHIHSKKNSHITAASTPKDHAFGYVFFDCIFTSDTAVNRVSLGRPWRPYASVVYLHCYLDRHILPAGWDNWRNPENEKSARYAEYKNYGPGARPESRVPWSRQLTQSEAVRIRPALVLSGWAPKRKRGLGKRLQQNE